MDLAKKDKKVAREIIEKGLQKEYENGLRKAEKVLTQWRNNTLGNREAYHELYGEIIKFDKRIARRYDGMSGSRYGLIVFEQLVDGLILESDLDDFSEEVKKWLLSATKALQ